MVGAQIPLQRKTLNSEWSRQKGNEERLATPPIWSYLWRGAVAASVIPVAFLIYSFYRDPYFMFGSLPLIVETVVVSSTIGGTACGVIWYLRRKLNRPIKLILRITVTTGVGGLLMMPVGLYQYFLLRQEFGNDFGSILSAAASWFLVGSVVGVSAGLVAPSSKRNLALRR